MRGVADLVETMFGRSAATSEIPPFTTESVYGLTVRKRRDYPTEHLVSLLRAHEEAKLLRDARLVKDSRRGWVTVVQGSDIRYAPRFVVKEPRFGLPTRGRRGTLNVTRTRRAWRAAHAFAVRGLMVPEHLALVEKTAFGVPRRAWLIARYLDESRDLDYFLESHPNAPPEFFSQLTAAVSRLFDHGLYHRDLSGKNILIREVGQGRWQFFFLDLESVMLGRRLTARRRRKNIGQIYRSVRASCDARQRVAFLNEVSRATDVKDIPDV